MPHPAALRSEDRRSHRRQAIGPTHPADARRPASCTPTSRCAGGTLHRAGVRPGNRRPNRQATHTRRASQRDLRRASRARKAPRLLAAAALHLRAARPPAGRQTTAARRAATTQTSHGTYQSPCAMAIPARAHTAHAPFQSAPAHRARPPYARSARERRSRRRRRQVGRGCRASAGASLRRPCA